VIMIKGDRTLLVHQPHGSNPINYMKENSSHRIIVDDERVLLKSRNIPLKEFIDIAINKIHFVHSTKMQDGQKIELTGNEKDMSDMIAAKPSMIESGLRLVNREEQTKYGFIDILCHDQTGTLVVIECKRFKAGPKAVSQLRRYVEKVKKSRGLPQVRGILVAPKISDNAKAMLKDYDFTFVSIEPPRYMERFRKDQKRLGDF
jgi:endonuclease